MGPSQCIITSFLVETFRSYSVTWVWPRPFLTAHITLGCKKSHLVWSIFVFFYCKQSEDFVGFRPTQNCFELFKIVHCVVQNANSVLTAIKKSKMDEKQDYKYFSRFLSRTCLSSFCHFSIFCWFMINFDLFWCIFCIKLFWTFCAL